MSVLFHGLSGFNRNLTTAEIIGQLWYAKRALQADIQTARTARQWWRFRAIARVISNVVIMGMGEPLLNYDQVLGRCA